MSKTDETLQVLHCTIGLQVAQPSDQHARNVHDALARHEAAIKAEAWDEGHAAGIAFQAGNNSPHAYINPYKED